MEQYDTYEERPMFSFIRPQTLDGVYIISY
jgi:hypothetical protein